MGVALPVVITAVYLAGLAVLLWVSHSNRRLYAAAKGVCSGLFILVALVARFYGQGGWNTSFALLLAGLVLCAAGDVLLGVANLNATKVNKKPFVFGAFSFLVAHILFCVLFYLAGGIRLYDILLPAFLVVVLALLEKNDKIRLKKIRPLGYLYTFAVGAMAGKAFFSPVPAVVTGALLFLISDVVLLFLYFGTKRRKWYRAANLTTYYMGTYLLAWSAFCL